MLYKTILVNNLIKKGKKEKALKIVPESLRDIKFNKLYQNPVNLGSSINLNVVSINRQNLKSNNELNDKNKYLINIHKSINNNLKKCEIFLQLRASPSALQLEKKMKKKNFALKNNKKKINQNIRYIVYYINVVRRKRRLIKELLKVVKSRIGFSIIQKLSDELYDIVNKKGLTLRNKKRFYGRLKRLRPFLLYPTGRRHKRKILKLK